MSMPFIEGVGSDIYTGFGVQSDQYGDQSDFNLRRSDETINADLYDALGGSPYLAAVQSNQAIGDITRKNIEHARLQADTGMAIGTRFDATRDQAAGTLTIGDVTA